MSPAAYAWTAGVGLVTIGGIGGVLLALPLIGPSLVSIVSTLEPLLTVVLAYFLFSEELGPTQLFGWRARGRGDPLHRDAPSAGAPGEAQVPQPTPR